MASFSSILRILFTASEADPFVKIGGLGDVSGSLPRAIRRINLVNAASGWKSIDVRLVIPFHSTISQDDYSLRLIAAFDISSENGPISAEAYDTEIEGVPVYLISGEPIEGEGPVYSGDPILDGRKYVFFALASLELSRALGWQPHLLHANDWHTAPAVYALSTLYKNDPFFAQTASLLSVHNLPYLGVGTGSVMQEFGLPAAEESELPWWAKDLPMPLGLLSADHIAAVSETYAKEILTPEFGSGLNEFLQTRADSISGILNGLDQESWNPETDPHLPFNYNRDTISVRTANKASLQAELGLANRPQCLLLGMVTRMDNQKGVDLALAALRELALEMNRDNEQPDWQAVLLGTGQPELEAAAMQMEAEFPERFRVAVRFDRGLSRRIYGAADALLIPSRYEPCGLTQMIGMRYGCIPIARSTGGLGDTVHDVDASEHATGFLFSEASSASLAEAIRRAQEVYKNKPHWRELQRNSMLQDFSWERSAQRYLSLYDKLVLCKQEKQSKSGKKEDIETR